MVANDALSSLKVISPPSAFSSISPSISNVKCPAVPPESSVLIVVTALSSISILKYSKSPAPVETGL